MPVANLDLVEYAALQQPDDDCDDARDEDDEEEPEEPADVGAGGLFAALLREPGVTTGGISMDGMRDGMWQGGRTSASGLASALLLRPCVQRLRSVSRRRDRGLRTW